MSRRIGKVVLIEPEALRTCTACGKEKECRPYGKNGADVCFDCAMSTPQSKKEAEQQMNHRLFGNPKPS